MRKDPDRAGRSEFCACGMRYIEKEFGALAREVKGAGEGDDPEHIHRMRVASRRLRAALPIFSSCLPKKEYRAWFGAMRSVTRSVGAARDLDVQIGFLEEYIRSGKGGDPDRGSSAGLDALLSALKAGRAALQPDIEAISGLFSREGVFSGLPEAARAARKGGRSRIVIGKRASRETGRRYAALEGFDSSARDPAAIEAHHALRIALKKYRYTMEIFDRACGGEYRESIRQVKKIQEVLGMMHDCDVWIAALRDTPFLKEGVPAGDPGLASLLRDREERRMVLYRKFARLWDRFREAHPDEGRSDRD